MRLALVPASLLETCCLSYRRLSGATHTARWSGMPWVQHTNSLIARHLQRKTQTQVEGELRGCFRMEGRNGSIGNFRIVYSKKSPHLNFILLKYMLFSRVLPSPSGPTSTMQKQAVHISELPSKSTELWLSTSRRSQIWSLRVIDPKASNR